jgi:very-short-patch-repair endonuclease
VSQPVGAHFFLGCYPQAGRRRCAIHRFPSTPSESGDHPQCLDVKHDTLIDDLLRTQHVILLREHLTLQRALAQAARDGRLARVLPGVYVDAGAAADRSTRMAAVMRWDPNAVICGRAAASLTYWPDVRLDTIEVASTMRHTPQPGYRFTHRTVPPDLVQQIGEIRLTNPSLTAIELATLEFTDPIDIALRSRLVTLASLTDALRATPQRAGNRHRWEVLLDSRAEPWSRAERMAHRIYRDAGIAGWVTNRKTVIPDWATYYLDIAFEELRVAVEIDGWAYHSQADVFESDRLRQNALVLDGWIVLRFTWRMVTEDPDYLVRTTLEALAAARGIRMTAGGFVFRPGRASM